MSAGRNGMKVVLLAAFLAVLFGGLPKAVKALGVARTDLARGIVSTEQSERRRAIRSLRKERKEYVDFLCSVLGSGSSGRYSDETRACSAYLLGELRAEEAIPVLVSALENPPLGDRTIFDPFIESSGTVFSALAKMGRPAIPSMVEILESSDHPNLPNECATVLLHVLGGKRRTLELLDKLIDRGRDEQTRQRLVRARRFVQSVEETKEPLY